MQCVLVLPGGMPMPAAGRGGPALPIGGIPPGGRNPEIVGEDKHHNR